MSEEFVSQYIQESTQMGIGLRSDICKRALERIKEIDSVIAEADRLRPEKANLMGVLKALNYESPRPSRRAPAFIIHEETTQDDLSPEDLERCLTICDLLEEKGQFFPRDAMLACGISVENDALVNSLIKWLFQGGVISRSTTDGAIIKGVKWSNRPTRPNK